MVKVNWLCVLQLTNGEFCCMIYVHFYTYIFEESYRFRRGESRENNDQLEKYIMKKRISIVFLSIIIVFTAISGIVGCSGNTAPALTDKDLILYYKEEADGENRIFTNADEYDAESGIFNLTLEVEQSEYDFNAHFRAPSGQKWSLYADAEGREHIATKRVVNFKNGENLFYLVVQDRNETCQKTYVVRIDKKYLVTLSHKVKTLSIHIHSHLSLYDDAH